MDELERKSRQRATKAIRSSRTLVPRSSEERHVLDQLTTSIRGGGSIDVGEKALLHWAKMNQHEKVQQLCDAGIAVDAADHWGNTALILASMYNSVDTVQTLLACSANPNAQNKWAGTALIESASRGFAQVAHALVDAGANVNSQNRVGDTALALAVYSGHVNIVQMLVEHGSDPTLRDGKGKTARDRSRECKESADCNHDVQRQIMELVDRDTAAADQAPMQQNQQDELHFLRAELSRAQEKQQELQGAMDVSIQLAEAQNIAARQRIAELEIQLNNSADSKREPPRTTLATSNASNSADKTDHSFEYLHQLVRDPMMHVAAPHTLFVEPLTPPLTRPNLSRPQIESPSEAGTDGSILPSHDAVRQSILGPVEKTTHDGV